MAVEHELARVVEQLSPTQQRLLASVANALAVPVEVTNTENSDFVGAVFAETMGDILTVHHALHEEALNKKAFEYLIKNCFLASGSKSELNPRPGGEAWDVIGAGQRWSLKTEAAGGISRNQIRIEKLMEARWVREATTPELCARNVRARLPGHMTGYDRILILRAFAGAGNWEYLLQEIPKQLLVESFQSCPDNLFARGRSLISFGADFPDATGTKAFRILLDSSVEKVRLWFESDAAVLHGRWVVRVDDVRAAQQKVIER